MSDKGNDQACYVEPILKVVDPRNLEKSASAVLGIAGMGCPACATRVRNSLLAWPGVLQVEINLEYGLAKVNYDPKRTLYRDLLEAVAAAGDGRHVYQAILVT